MGALALVAGRPVALDLVSRADAFASLLPRLAQGYALDALHAEDAEADPFEAERFLDSALRATRVELPDARHGAWDPSRGPRAHRQRHRARRGARFSSPRSPPKPARHQGEGDGGAPIARPSRRRRAA